MHEKNLLQLVPNDFQQFPVWIDTDNIDDEDEVAPCMDCAVLDKEDAIYYVAAEFVLADGSKYDGYIRLANGRPTVICLAVTPKSFAMFVLLEAIRLTLKETPYDFARQLQKTVSGVFPIKYRTNFQFVDGTAVQGTVN
jgi:hypothetical protein